MMTQVLHCPYCQGTDILRHGTTPEGKQRYRCHACPERGRTFLLEYTYAGRSCFREYAGRSVEAARTCSLSEEFVVPQHAFGLQNAVPDAVLDPEWRALIRQQARTLARMLQRIQL